MVEVVRHIFLILDNSRGSDTILFNKIKSLFCRFIVNILVMNSKANIATFYSYLKKNWKSSDNMSLLYESPVQRNLFQKNVSNIDF